MEFEAKTSMVLKHILYTLLCENFFRGPQKVSRRETETWRVRAHFGQSIFSFFQQQRKKDILLILTMFAYFKVQKKREKKKKVRINDHFSNFEVKFKNTKNTVNG